MCIRFENRHNAECVNLMVRNGDKLLWAKSCRYLGVYFVYFVAKCLPALLDAVESCPVNTGDKQSFDFRVNRIFMKILRTNSISVIEDCHRYLKFRSVKLIIDIHIANFIQKFSAAENHVGVCVVFKRNYVYPSVRLSVTC